MKILCIIVLYNQSLYDTLSYKTCIKSYLGTNDFKLFIYDNSTKPQHSQDEFDDIIYLSNPQNPGLSVAYNCGAKYASELGYEWMLILDQDTLFPDNRYISVFREAYEENKTIKLFAPRAVAARNAHLSPSYIFHHIPRSKKIALGAVYSISNMTLINSGLIINVSAFWEIGGYNENVFLDFSDHQFIERFKTLFSDFFLLDYTIVQDFSDNEIDISKLERRFEIYCKCAVKYVKIKLFDHIDFFYIVMKHAISLTLRTHKIYFIVIFIKNFLFNRNND